jgi:WD40 repeat protein
LAVISGPQRAVSYVRFMGGGHLVSASTDSTLRLWDLKEVLACPAATSASGGSSAASGGGGGGRLRPACTYTGHRNQRNFVGLSVSADGHMLCGSEDNSGDKELLFLIVCQQSSGVAAFQAGLQETNKDVTML